MSALGGARGRTRWAAALGAVAAGAAALVLLWPRGGAFVSYPAAEVAQVRDVHSYQGKPLCQACHPGLDAKLAADPMATCAGCHPFEKHRSHAVGVAQRAPPAAAVKLPFGPGGIIVCHTCHDPHLDMKTSRGLRHADDPNALCLACHQQH